MRSADESKNANIAVAIRIPYSASSTDVSAQVLQLKEKNPDVVIFISYTAEFNPLHEDDEESRLQAADGDR